MPPQAAEWISARKLSIIFFTLEFAQRQRNGVFMNNKYTLCDARIGECVKVINIHPNCPIKRRLCDIGIIEGTPIKCLFQNAGKNMKAYLIRGAIIAIRNDDCAYISVFREEQDHEK